MRERETKKESFLNSANGTVKKKKGHEAVVKESKTLLERRKKQKSIPKRE